MADICGEDRVRVGREYREDDERGQTRKKALTKS